jgi:putative phosphoribosyl transferase
MGSSPALTLPGPKEMCRPPGVGHLPTTLSHGPVIVGQPPLLADLEVPPLAGALVIIVHEDSADCRSSGQQFIADVLQANRFCTLSVGLRTAEEAADGQVRPSADECCARIRRLMDWVGAQPALGHRCVALLGMAGAVPACINAARTAGEAFIHSMVLVDGPLAITSAALPALDMPTLLLAGRSDATALTRYLAITETLSGQHQIDLIPGATQPVTEPGALESIACAAAAWFARSLPPPRAGVAAWWASAQAMPA